MVTEEFEKNMKEAIGKIDFEKINNYNIDILTSIINEAYLKTILTLGIDIMSKIDNTKSKEEIGKHYVEYFVKQVQDVTLVKSKAFEKEPA